MSSADAERGPGRPLAGFAVAVVVGHHLGTVLKPLGTVGPAEWADWFDLLVPVTVLGLAARVLLTAAPTRDDWLRLAAGGLAYTQGHALHLGANSVSNAGPTGRARDAAHLWDEVVSHHIWYAGLGLVVLALLLALVRADLPARDGPLGHLLAGAFGVTLANNGIEGGTVALSLAIAAALLVVAVRRRRSAAARLAVTAYAVGLVLILGWGAWHRGFPQFSELGWI